MSILPVADPAEHGLAIAQTIEEMRHLTAVWRRRGERIALVPTMGALHAGHLSLVDLARRHADRVVVSIFVNPRQFNDPKDFARYPRDVDGDLDLLSTRAVDCVWLPPVAIMYPQGFRSMVRVEGLTDVLCGVSRPGHFDGVTTVVAKLFNQVQPDLAVFGEKDFQQLQVIRRMVQDLNLPIRILGAPTIREYDGLALSSRNRLLSADQRFVAPALYGALKAAREVIQDGQDVAEALTRAEAEIQQAGFGPVDYLMLIDAEDLRPVTSFDPRRSHRLAVAAFLGQIRLIDNIPI